MKREVHRFLEDHTEQLRPMQIEARLAFWESATTGREEAAQRAARLNAEVRKLYTDAAALERVRGWLDRGGLDPIAHRQLVLLRDRYIANQLPVEVIQELEDRSQAIEHTFNTFRARVAGRAVTDNQIRSMLETELDTPLRREAWEASKEIGARIEAPLRDLARRRNDAARSLEFPDFYTMELRLQEIEPAELERITTDVDLRTAEPFAAAKAAIDTALAERLGVSPAELRPWHYADPFFQEPPPAGDVDLDRFFTGTDVVELSRRYFGKVGLPVDSVLERSDLYEREGKDQHAFCMDVDQAGDVRVLCNVTDNARWMGTMLHELGHAVYDLYMPDSLPYLLRAPAHTLTTEAVAMFFGARVREAEWLKKTLGTDDEEMERLGNALPASRARDLLVFARWASVMIHFEREFYRDPERQDLNRVWWDLVGRLQGLQPPEQVDGGHHWATKIHLAVAPVYYHNYLLGELFAAQLRGRSRAENVADGEALGEFFRKRVFEPGASVTWDALVLNATGAPLSARHFGDELAGSF